MRQELHHRTHVDEFHLYREGEGFYQYTDDDYLVLGEDTAGVYRVDGVTQKDSLTGEPSFGIKRPTTTSATRPEVAPWFGGFLSRPNLCER